MKSALLLASLPAAALASAAAPQDPAAIERAWQAAVERSKLPVVAGLDLKSGAQPTPPPFEVTGREPAPAPAPAIRPPAPDAKPPRGAKPYHFNGETYWLVPILQDAPA